MDGFELSPGTGAKLPIGFGVRDDAMLQSAARSYGNEYGAGRHFDARKAKLASGYDVPGMNRAATICHWGRSGSLLLSSYLDHHPHIVMLPYAASESIYNFFEEYESLSVWEKLVAYPTYSASKKGADGDFFLKNNPVGDFAIEAVDYYGAVHAFFEAYGDAPSSWLVTRSAFFQLLHAVYGVASGRTLATARPLMVHAQHYMDERLAARLVEDFPDARFIHTIRDPITSIDSWFDRRLEMEMYGCGNRLETKAQYLDMAVATMIDLLAWDAGHRHMESRTRAVRFEDMHTEPEAVMRKLADWLGIPFLPCMLESTWNGTPYVVRIRGVPSCGPNPANAKRRSRNLNVADRLLIYALMHANFAAWKYPSPAALERGWLRVCVIAVTCLLPMKMEMLTARLVVLKQALPALANGRIAFFLGAPLFLLARRLRMMWVVVTAARLRLSGRNALLKVLMVDCVAKRS
jgi:hypothetical protein